MKLVTTSWDDGHIKDFRLADLLEKYKLAATFYIPAKNTEHAVMNEKQVIELSGRFEIGGHTMNHTRIRTHSKKIFDAEIGGCYKWLSDLLAKKPNSFCFPGGVLNKVATEYAFKTGFQIVRTTELLNPLFDKNEYVIPTTLQVYHHNRFTYYKHLAKRFKLNSLLLYLKSNKSKDLKNNLEFYLSFIQEYGGCFHLWGHSWEIDAYNLWIELEDLFKILSDIPELTYVSNEGLLKYKNAISNQILP